MKWLSGLFVIALLAFAVPLGSSGQSWASPDDADIRPGVKLRGGSCTTNFVFTDGAGEVYIGTAAHCVNNGPQTATNGCDSANTPWSPGRGVSVSGATHTGTLAYSSWYTMQQEGETSTIVCAGNDFAVIRLHPDDHHRVSPAMLGYGGPTGVAQPGEHMFGERIMTFGNSGLRIFSGGVWEETKAREGYSTSTNAGWKTGIYVAGPGVPGDSGSAVLSSDGTALGDLVTLSATASNGVTNLYRALEYANTVGGMDLELATWNVLDPGLLPDGGTEAQPEGTEPVYCMLFARHEDKPDCLI